MTAPTLTQSPQLDEVIKAQIKAMYDATCLDVQCYERLLEAAKQKRAALAKALGYRGKEGDNPS